MARFVFIVQGEGRGHMSQAMAMRQFLERNGHELSGIFLGTCRGKRPPDYFLKAGKGLIRTFISPYFVQTDDHRGIRIARSFLDNLLRTGLYLKEIRSVTDDIKKINPDYIINFYDLLGSFILRRLPSRITRIVISHHFYLEHPDFTKPPGDLLQKILLKSLNRMMQRGCHHVAALSFREAANRGRIRVVPPLIREEITNLERKPGKKDLVYLLHAGFLTDLVRIASQEDAFEADVFLDTIPESPVPSNLELHLPDSDLFIEKLRTCRKLITTAGFDTVAEAASLSVPVLAIPSKNHFEQRCNACDMERAGLGLRLKALDPGTVNENMDSRNADYLLWIGQSEKQFLKLIEK